MAFSLKRKESVTSGWPRIIQAEFDGVAAGALALGTGKDRANAVHTTRRHLKKLRALHQLWHGLLGADLCAQETDILRDMASHLSTARDWAVKADLLKSIIDESGLRENTGLSHLLQQWNRERGRAQRFASTPASVLGLTKTLDKARKRSASLPAVEDGWHFVGEALSRSYRRARNGFVESMKCDENDAEVIHQWRKRTKILEYQLGVVRKMHLKISAMARKLHLLTECLGKQRDFFMLSVALGEADAALFENATRSKIMALIKQHRSKLRRRAMKLGSHLFDEKPQAFAARLRRCWHEWRK